ncbi:BspA type Leucine rich repeat region [anaerobic digester metagenome]
MTIYHGIGGLIPVLGIKQFTDGLYYWTIDGDWMTEEGGEMIRAQGVDGQDGANGITPQLKIENESWMLSVDNGSTWSDLGKAKGEDGDSFFQSVTQDEDNIYLNLVDGTIITLPKEKQLVILFDESVDISITDGATKTLNYSIIGATEKTIVKAMGQNGWSAKVTPTDNESGTITVTAPDPLIEDEILVWVYDGENKTIMSSLNFVTGVIEIVSNTYSLPKDALSQTVTVNTNIDYIVEIPEDALLWLSVLSTRSTMRTETLTFSLAENTGFTRYATVYLKNNAGKILQTIAFEQKGGSIVINVSTPGTLSTLLTDGQKQNLTNLALIGTLDNSDLILLSQLSSLQYLDISNITKTNLPVGLFKENKILTNVKLPNNLNEIPEYLFYYSNIKECNIPNKITNIGNNAFAGSKLTGELKLPISVESIGFSAFMTCTNLTKLTLNEGLLTITNAFAGCSGLQGRLIIPTSVVSIEANAFYACRGLTGDLVIPKNVEKIGLNAFLYCSGINKIYCKNPNPPILESSSLQIFPNYKYLGVPIGCKTTYQTAAPKYATWDKWSNFLIIEEVDFTALGL